MDELRTHSGEVCSWSEQAWQKTLRLNPYIRVLRLSEESGMSIDILCFLGEDSCRESWRCCDRFAPHGMSSC